MNIRVTEPPQYPGVNPGICKECGRDIIWVETVRGAKAALDDDSGPYRLEMQDDGIIRAVHRHATDGYSYHYKFAGESRGTCIEPEPEPPKTSQFEQIATQIGERP
jgi:hypothetical protein